MSNYPNTYLVAEDLSEDDEKRLLSQSEIALDTETLGLDPIRDALCLVQICDSHGIVNLVKSHNWPNAVRLKSVLTSPVTKVIHYAIYDCSMILMNIGVEVVHPYCTRFASKIARTYGSNHSLAGLVKELVSVDLPKEAQTSDWTGQLTNEQLEYATNDVRYLLEVKHKLEEKLANRRLMHSGWSYKELNRHCQEMIPALVQLRLNGWTPEGIGTAAFFGH